MPTYEYECTHCGHRFEVLQKMTDKPLEACPKCNKRVKRLIGSGAGIIFSRKYSQRTESGSRYNIFPMATSGKGSGKEPTTCPIAKEGCRGCPQA